MTASAPRRLVTAAAVPGALCPVSGQGLGPAMASRLHRAFCSVCRQGACFSDVRKIVQYFYFCGEVSW